MGATLVGISSDTVASHCSFAEDEELPFPILSDEDNRVRKQYRVEPSMFGLLPGRVTYVIGRDRIVHSAYRSQLRLVKHVESARQGLDSLRARMVHVPAKT